MQGNNNGSFFDQLEKKTNVKHQDLFQLAQSVNKTDLSNEENVRQLIHQVAKLANVSVSKEKEDELVKAITSNKVPMDFSSLAKMFQKPK
ncbi:stage VI sporulation protein F [Salipaludibacillus agaradhaerens]|uniref:Stage VI sporulation protein F n=1 Tax=Salipaludibacillus agaradhaerens TaxID=76935 RepID=A0A9Q4B1P4_SALAG|nr:stage VI sporulation protein F [Salipaludibacillus agaradhaerens]MCR6096530.1 stage VI sporulation protein F [Salipaludibacillus agaradhaerens]MCR6113911.1 stage VI sporulation protein F [Salipaludibacillus agaradhaerens]